MTRFGLVYLRDNESEGAKLAAPAFLGGSLWGTPNITTPPLPTSDNHQHRGSRHTITSIERKHKCFYNSFHSLGLSLTSKPPVNTSTQGIVSSSQIPTQAPWTPSDPKERIAAYHQNGTCLAQRPLRLPADASYFHSTGCTLATQTGQHVINPKQVYSQPGYAPAPYSSPSNKSKVTRV